MAAWPILNPIFIWKISCLFPFTEFCLIFPPQTEKWGHHDFERQALTEQGIGAPPERAAYAPRRTTTPVHDPAVHNIQRRTSFQFMFTSVFNTHSAHTVCIAIIKLVHSRLLY